MTQLRKYRDSISNYFDDLTRGLGKRGSSFMDVDAVSHDKDTERFLFQEFKQEAERLHPSTRMVLDDLSHLPRCTVWFVRRLEGGTIGWAQFGSGKREIEITESEYKRLFQAWWAGNPIIPNGIKISEVQPTNAEPSPMLGAEDIRWG